MSGSTIQTVQDVSFGIAGTTGVMSVITQNATAISVICTVVFGIVYVSCAICNAWSNHRRNKISQSAITADILSKLPPELQEQVKFHMGIN